jgi:protocatechuate 3,4-dioxygenase alpha subunit
MPKQTPSQTVGPFFAYSLAAPQYGYDGIGIASNSLADSLAPGERIRVLGRVFDGHGDVISDALIELWQADAEGRYPNLANAPDSSFRGFGRFGTGTDPQSCFRFHTIKPGRVDEAQAPHITVIVLMRGMLSHAYTRIYFSDEAALNAADPVLLSVPAERRATLIARREDDPAAAIYHFDIHMQGERETVFFDV